MNDNSPIVVDTSALYALISSTDRFHLIARGHYVEMIRARRRLWVTSYVLVEFGAITQRRLGFETLRAFYHRSGESISTLWIDRARHESAWEELELAQGKGLNFVDWTVLLAARDLGASIFTFDGGFLDRGVELIPGAVV